MAGKIDATLAGNRDPSRGTFYFNMQWKFPTPQTSPGNPHITKLRRLGLITYVQCHMRHLVSCLSSRYSWGYGQPAN